MSIWLSLGIDPVDYGYDPHDESEMVETNAPLTPEDAARIQADYEAQLKSEAEMDRLVPVFDRWGDVVAWRDRDDPAPPTP